MKQILAHNRGTVLNSVLERAAMISSLNQQIQQHLAQECRPFVQVSNYEHGVLFLLVDSPSWGTRLRYETPNLLHSFRNCGLPGLASIKIIQRPPNQFHFVATKKVHRPACNAATSNNLSQLCSSLEQSSLRTSLEKLAATLRAL